MFAFMKWRMLWGNRNVQADPAAAAEAYNHYLDKLKVQEALRRGVGRGTGVYALYAMRTRL